MASIKQEIENGTTTVATARKVAAIIIIVGLGALLLGISIGGYWF